MGRREGRGREERERGEKNGRSIPRQLILGCDSTPASPDPLLLEEYPQSQKPPI